MRISMLLALMAALLAPSALAGMQEGPSSRCNGHMCPVARAACDVGNTVVARIALVRVDASEFLS